MQNKIKASSTSAPDLRLRQQTQQFVQNGDARSGFVQHLTAEMAQDG
jgi:hypothetical protein